MYLNHLTLKKLVVSLLSLTLLLNLNPLALAHISPQDPSFDLRPTDSGFYGTYTVGSVSYEYNVNRYPQLHESRIQTANGKTIASCVLHKNKVTVTLSRVVVEFNMSDQTMAPLSGTEVTALKDFSTGSEAAVAREIIVNIISHREGLAPQSLFGIVVLGMILGDQNNVARDVSPNSPQHSAEKKSLSLLVKAQLAHAYESSPRKAELLRECQQKHLKQPLKGKV